MCRSSASAGEKHVKDKDAAVKILNALVDSGQGGTIRNVFLTMPKRWQGIVKKQLADITDRKILEILNT